MALICLYRSRFSLEEGHFCIEGIECTSLALVETKQNCASTCRKPAAAAAFLSFFQTLFYTLVIFQVKVEWTQQLVATQKQRTERIRKETENMKAILDAERGRQVEAIKTTQHIEQEEGRANVTRIQNEVFEEKRRMEADVSSYVAASAANSNKELLTDNYIKLQLGQLLSNNTKMYFSGPDSVLGSVLQKVFTPN